MYKDTNPRHRNIIRKRDKFNDSVVEMGSIKSEQDKSVLDKLIELSDKGGAKSAGSNRSFDVSFSVV